MRQLTLLLFFLFLSLPKIFGQGNVTTYEYDGSGNVVKRTVTVRRSQAARSKAAKDTAQFVSISYDRTRSVVSFQMSAPPKGSVSVSISICNAATRLPMDSFSFDGERFDLDISHYPKGVYVIEATREERSATRKIAK